MYLHAHTHTHTYTCVYSFAYVLYTRSNCGSRGGAASAANNKPQSCGSYSDAYHFFRVCLTLAPRITRVIFIVKSHARNTRVEFDFSKVDISLQSQWSSFRIADNVYTSIIKLYPPPPPPPPPPLSLALFRHRNICNVLKRKVTAQKKLRWRTLNIYKYTQRACHAIIIQARTYTQQRCPLATLSINQNYSNSVIDGRRCRSLSSSTHTLTRARANAHPLSNPLLSLSAEKKRKRKKKIFH